MKNKKTSNYILIIFLIAIVGANVLAIIWFNNTVFSQLESSAKESLKDMATEEQRIVSLLLNNKETGVISIVDSIVQIGNSTEQLMYYMPMWEERFQIDNLILSDMEGIGITSDGKVVDISSGSFIELAKTGERAITNLYISEVSGETVLALSAPVYYEGTVQAIVVAEYTVGSLTNLLITSTDSRGYSMILNRNSEILVHTYPFDISFENFVGAEFEDSVTYQTILDDFANLESGSATFSIDGDRKFSEYIPLGVGELMLFFESSESELSGAASGITGAMISVSISLGVVFLLLIGYILWSRRDSIRKIEEVAYFDELTGLPNQVKFKLDVTKMLQQSDIDASKYVLIKCDISNFKAINEVYGFDIGNGVITSMANTIRSLSSNKTKVARVGTDEFLLFGENQRIEEKLIVENAIQHGLIEDVPEIKKHMFSFRYGRYYVELGENSIDDMISKVSMAHSYSKSERGMAIWNYDEIFKKHLIHLTEMTNKMREALNNHEFKLFLQPKYRVSDEKIIGAEALVRWIELDGKMNFPGEFLPLFEKNGFILLLDKYMFERACAFIKKRIDENKTYVPISVNFSRKHFENPNFVDELLEIVNKYQVPIDMLEIELTETTIIENESNVKHKLQELRSVGFCVSVDDFGSGYSSLGMLKDYKVDVIKLDRSFFVQDDEDEQGNTVVEGIVSLINNLGPKIIAEGIETAEQVEFLKTVNCYAIQGYYYAKPMICDEFEGYI